MTPVPQSRHPRQSGNSQPDVEAPDDPTGEAGLNTAIEHLIAAQNN